MSDDFLKSVLGIDTSLSGCVIGLLNPLTKRFHENVLKTDRAQSVVIVPMIQKLLMTAGVEFKDVGLIVTTIGPGSFTGLRIGMMTARTLGMSLGVPVQGVGTMDVMIKSCAKMKGNQHGYACVLETKRSDFYCGIVDSSFNNVGDFYSGTHEDFIQNCEGKNLTLCGDAVTRFLSMGGNERFSDSMEISLLDARTLCEEGLRVFQENDRKSIKPEPLYLRGADVSISSKIQREINNFPI